MMAAFADGVSWEDPLLRGAKLSLEDEVGLAESVVHAVPSQKAYARLCPESWSEAGEGCCSAPSDYSGFCKTKMHVANLSIESKHEIEMACDVCWPPATKGAKGV